MLGGGTIHRADSAEQWRVGLQSSLFKHTCVTPTLRY
jgi:hypothetical protein